MKRLMLTCCLLLAALSYATAQQLLHTREFPLSNRLYKVLTLENGYLVLGHREREESRNQVITTYYKPFLAKLNAKLETIWETRFPESEFPTFNSVAEANGAYYLNGNHHRPGNQHTKAKLVKVSEHGHIEFEKHYASPGFHSVEGFHILPLPEGDLVVCNRKYRKFNSYGSPWVLRLDSEGTKVWEKGFGEQYYSAGPSRMLLTSKGNVVLLGFTYANKTDFRGALESGWICEFDASNPNLIIHDKVLRNHRDYLLRDAIELADGGWWIVGNATNLEKKQKVSVVAEYDENWKMRVERVLDLPKDVKVMSTCWNEKTGKLELVGSTGQHPRRQSILVSLDVEWELLSTQLGSKGVAYQVEAQPNGDLVMVHGKQLSVLR